MREDYFKERKCNTYARTKKIAVFHCLNISVIGLNRLHTRASDGKT